MSSSSNYPSNIPLRRPPLIMMEQTVKWQPNKIESAPDCPRCSSSNTKFCYYNNYSVSQPRYFCKSCRRYWTKGGFLRNVPVGGGCRKSTRRGRSARQPPSVETSGGGSTFAKCPGRSEESNEAASSFVGMRDETVCGESAAEIQQVHDGQDFVYGGFDGLDMGGMFGGEMWAEGTEMPLMQLQEFEVFTSDDQIRMSENLVSTDNWGSFDLSGYDNF